VKDSFAWFKDLVKPRRHMDAAALQTVSDGRVFTGRQAIGLKLVDELGDEKTAVKWLQAQNKIKGDLPVRDYKLAPRFSDMTFLRVAAATALESLGLPTVARFIGGNGAASLSDQLQLDGMLALWRPGGTN